MKLIKRPPPAPPAPPARVTRMDRAAYRALSPEDRAAYRASRPASRPADVLAAKVMRIVALARRWADTVPSDTRCHAMLLDAGASLMAAAQCVPEITRAPQRSREITVGARVVIRDGVRKHWAGLIDDPTTVMEVVGMKAKRVIVMVDGGRLFVPRLHVKLAV